MHFCFIFEERMNPFILTLKTYNLNVEIHKHAAFQIVLSENNPFTSIIDGKECPNIFGFIIKPNVSHLCTANNSTINIINIEPYSSVGLGILSKFPTNGNCITFKSQKEINNYFAIKQATFDIGLIVKSILNSIKSNQTDERILKIVDYIKTNYFQQDIIPQTFADLIFLSPSRLASLFKQQTGSSISKYLLWTRLRQAIYLSLADKSKTLTDIAYDTGFYDLPQLNKYMYEMFGVPPKGLKHNSDLIQVL